MKWRIVKRWIPKEGDQWFSLTGNGWCGLPRTKDALDMLRIIRPKVRRKVQV